MLVRVLFIGWLVSHCCLLWVGGGWVGWLAGPFCSISGLGTCWRISTRPGVSEVAPGVTEQSDRHGVVAHGGHGADQLGQLLQLRHATPAHVAHPPHDRWPELEAVGHGDARGDCVCKDAEELAMSGE